MEPNLLSQIHTYESCIVAQPDGDLGDAPQRTAMFYAGCALIGRPLPESFARAIELLQDKSGRLIRDPQRWNDPADISRDQEEPWLIALAIYGHDDRARKIIFRRWRRGGRYANSDVMNPSSLATDFRALGWRWALPLMWFGDFWSCLGALVDCAKARLHRGEDGPWLDKDNAVTRLAFARAQLRTPLASLAIRIYKKFFPPNPGGEGIGGALKNKHRNEVGNPALAELWLQLWSTLPETTRPN